MKLLSKFIDKMLNPMYSGDLVYKDSLVDYTYYLELIRFKEVECVIYSKENPYTLSSNVKHIKHEFKVNVDMFDNEYGINDSLYNELEPNIIPVLEEFYTENRDNLVVFYPINRLDYVNTVSQGWYLLFDREENKLTLECIYRTFKEV